jgi:hypothetical protein
VVHRARCPRRAIARTGCPGFTPSETATFVFSLKQPLFSRLRTQTGDSRQAYDEALWTTTVLLDKLGFYTAEVFIKSREELISPPGDGDTGAIDTLGQSRGSSRFL